ncbi:MAG TPA: PEP-CTERM sorting domain-containing protein, partial [Burkholderiaceae bacterium]
MKRTSPTAALLALAACFASATASAVPIIYFGENQSPGGVVSGAPLTARTSFLSALTGVGNQTFESYAVGTPAPLALSFPGSAGAITATLTGAGDIENNTGAGRFNTSPGGSKWYEVSGSFNIAFSNPISAFGFYGTDVGDFNGQITLSLLGGGTTNLTVNNTVNGNDGSLLFFGFIDPTQSYTSIQFGNTNAGTDIFGFDDMVIGDSQQVSVPEPATMAILGLGLLGMGALRRK